MLLKGVAFNKSNAFFLRVRLFFLIKKVSRPQRIYISFFYFVRVTLVRGENWQTKLCTRYLKFRCSRYSLTSQASAPNLLKDFATVVNLTKSDKCSLMENHFQINIV